MNYILYNPLSGEKNGREVAQELAKALSEAKEIIDMTSIKDYGRFFSMLSDTDTVTVIGGDGTLNRFVNEISEQTLPCEVLYLPLGSGNDFAKDVCPDNEGKSFSIGEYIKNLPLVTVNGKQVRFINGVGYGIDGYCCAVGDELRRKNKKIDYTAIAVKGLLFYYKPTSATVIVDGVEHSFKKVWIAPTMIGRHYGGGMIPTPEQKRDSGLLSTMIFHGSGKIKTLMIFPSIFKGEHVAKKKHVTVFEGKCITVKFDRPTFLQVDGETFWGVSEYTARIG